MFFLDDAEVRKSLVGIGLTLDSKGKVQIPSCSGQAISVNLEAWRGGDVALSRRIVAACGDFDWMIVLISAWGIWSSREDWNLYYRLRRTWGECSELRIKPGHKVLSCEQADLLTLIGLTMQNGWDAWLCPYPADRLVFLSHDGWAKFSADSATTLAEMEIKLGKGLEISHS